MNKGHPIQKWSQLRANGYGDGLMEVPSISTGIETGYGSVRYGIGKNGEPRLLVPVGADARTTVAESGGKLCVTKSRFHVRGKPSVFLDITCLERGLDSAFAEIADEILHRIVDGVAPAVAVSTTIKDFRSLLSQSAGDVESTRVVGLIGELLILEELSKHSEKAIHAWTGPEGQRHDFRNGSKAIEVKTSVRSAASSIYVSSLEQMTAPSDGTLILAHIVMERTLGGEQSVHNIVTRILQIGVPQSELDQKLALLGCLDAEAQEWNRLAFQLEAISLYEVGRGFPRLTAESFKGAAPPGGVSDINYVIDLSFASSFQVSKSMLKDVFQEFLS